MTYITQQYLSISFYFLLSPPNYVIPKVRVTAICALAALDSSGDDYERFLAAVYFRTLPDLAAYGGDEDLAAMMERSWPDGERVAPKSVASIALEASAGHQQYGNWQVCQLCCCCCAAAWLSRRAGRPACCAYHLFLGRAHSIRSILGCRVGLPIQRPDGAVPRGVLRGERAR